MARSRPSRSTPLRVSPASPTNAQSVVTVKYPSGNPGAREAAQDVADLLLQRGVPAARFAPLPIPAVTALAGRSHLPAQGCGDQGLRRLVVQSRHRNWQRRLSKTSAAPSVTTWRPWWPTRRTSKARAPWSQRSPTTAWRPWYLHQEPARRRSILQPTLPPDRPATADVGSGGDTSERVERILAGKMK